MDSGVDRHGPVKLTSRAEWRARACGVFIGLIGGLVMTAAFQWIFPPDIWVTFHSITIDNVYSGECAQMEINRDVHQRFRGVYSFDLHRVYGEGENARQTVISTGNGERDYRPSEFSPFTIEITNRLASNVCPLEPGMYYVHGSIRPIIPIINPAAATVDSNIFTVYATPRPSTGPQLPRGNNE